MAPDELLLTEAPSIGQASHSSSAAGDVGAGCGPATNSRDRALKDAKQENTLLKGENAKLQCDNKELKRLWSERDQHYLRTDKPSYVTCSRSYSSAVDLDQ